MQLDCFPTDFTQLKSGETVLKTSRLLTLAPKFDSKEELIWVGGRLCHSSQLDPEAIYPVVPHAKHPITRLVIKEFDEQLHHPGPQKSLL